VDNRTHVSGHTQKTQSKHKKKQSTGNALYRMAWEEEERRSRRHKVRALIVLWLLRPGCLH
jgi:hypothetical protein